MRKARGTPAMGARQTGGPTITSVDIGAKSVRGDKCQFHAGTENVGKKKTQGKRLRILLERDTLEKTAGNPEKA